MPPNGLPRIAPGVAGLATCPGTETSDGYVLKIEVLDANRALDRFADYAFVIFKALCIQAGYDWNIFPKLERTSGEY